MLVLELFSCSGGMAEGLRRAGIDVTMAFDRDPDAIASYTANLGHAPVCLDVRDLHRMIVGGWSPGHVDLLCADPPCTPWSRAGKRLGTADERDMLEVTVEIIRLLRPTAYLLANVPGLDDGPNWPVVQRTIGSLARDGYCANDFTVFDCADYSVAQHRRRPFWYGHLSGPCIQWPERTHGSPEECAHPTLPGHRALKPWVTVKEALAHLSPEEMGRPVRLRWRSDLHPPSGMDRPGNTVPSSQPGNGGAVLLDGEPESKRLHNPGKRSRNSAKPGEPSAGVRVHDDMFIDLTSGPNHRASTADAPARTLTRNTHSDGALLVNDRHPVNSPDAPSMTVTTKGDCCVGQGSCVMTWPWDRPSTTVTGRAGLPPPGHHETSYMSAPNAIKLSEKAAMVLQGFPDGWRIAGDTKRAQFSQIGQAMPPPMAHAVGVRLKVALEAAIAARKTEAAEAAE